MIIFYYFILITQSREYLLMLLRGKIYVGYSWGLKSYERVLAVYLVSCIFSFPFDFIKELKSFSL